MAWFSVEDNLCLHPKVMAAGNAAMGLWVRAGSWSMQNMTEGHIPAEVAHMLGTPKDAVRLVKAGLWTVEPEGYRFHQWAARQRSRSKVESDRAASRERQRRLREGKGSDDG